MATTSTQQQKLTPQQIQAINTQFMAQSFEQTILCDAQNGTQYVPGQALNFVVPIIPGGWVTRLIVRHNLTVNYTPAGSNPTATLNAAKQYAAVQQILVQFGNTQVNVHPYFLAVLKKLRGYNRTLPGQGLQTVSADIQSKIYQPPTLNSGNNTWVWDVDIPLNSLHPMSVNGILPAMGTGTRIQITVVPTTQFVGVDPLQNVVNTNGTITVSGTIQVVAIYRDAKSFVTRQGVQPVLDGLATVQVIKPQEINPLTGSTYLYKRITNPYPFIRTISVVIDGNSSSTFAAASNITGFEIDAAENTSSMMLRYDDSDMSGGMEQYYRSIEERFGTQLDDGVLIFDAPSMNVANASNQNGSNFFDLTPNGYPAGRLGFKVNSVGAVQGITPRVVTYGWILNPAGIQAVTA